MLLIVGLPTLVAAGILAGITWFAILPPMIKEEIKTRSKTPKPGKRNGSGEGFGFLIFIGLCIYVFIDGNWKTEFGNLSYRYFMNAWITVFTWALIIFGISAVIIRTLWFVKKYGKSGITAAPY